MASIYQHASPQHAAQSTSGLDTLALASASLSKAESSMPTTKFRCAECHLYYHTSAELERHSKWSSHKAYSCDHVNCARAFASRYAWSRHKKDHLPNTPHQCSHCSKSFKRKDHLTEHVGKLHDGDVLDSSSSAFQGRESNTPSHSRPQMLGQSRAGLGPSIFPRVLVPLPPSDPSSTESRKRRGALVFEEIDDDSSSNNKQNLSEGNPNAFMAAFGAQLYAKASDSKPGSSSSSETDSVSSDHHDADDIRDRSLAQPEHNANSSQDTNHAGTIIVDPSVPVESSFQGGFTAYTPALAHTQILLPWPRTYAERVEAERTTLDAQRSTSRRTRNTVQDAPLQKPSHSSIPSETGSRHETAGPTSAQESYMALVDIERKSYRTESHAAAVEIFTEMYNHEVALPSAISPAHYLQDRPRSNDKASAACLSPPQSLVQSRLNSARHMHLRSTYWNDPTGQMSPSRTGSPLGQHIKKSSIKKSSMREYLRRNPSKTFPKDVTKTTSPRDAMLDYDENDSTEISVPSPGSPIDDPVQRPANTPASKGDYVCPHVGCSAWFDYTVPLRRHVCEFHD